MLGAVEKILRYTRGPSLDDLLLDEKTMDAVIRILLRRDSEVATGSGNVNA
jgi:uncharacterized protein with HEPN domain